MNQLDAWHFPLPRTHTGMLLGNGKMGVMIWGEGNVLRVTVNRADFWDHRGGLPWSEGMSYVRIRQLLEAGDEVGLRHLFEGDEPPPGQPRRPSLLPLGRIELLLDRHLSLTTGELDMRRGRVHVHAEGNGQKLDIVFDLAMGDPLLHISVLGGLQSSAGALPLLVRRVTAWEYVGEYLRQISFVEPQLFDGQDLSGWVQTRPADPPLCLGYRIRENELWLGLEYGTDVTTARAAVGKLIDRYAAQGIEKLRYDTENWWMRYWQAVPRLDIPNKRLDFLYRYGMFKFAGLTNPDGGIPAGLQGGWIEEYQMPPWSGDYHFNINVQMCYWPAYHGNRLDHLKPLFDMLDNWMPLLRQNARIFVGIDDGLMLPHAVDDRGTCMGGFWTGAVDHGCTAWVAQMMYDYYRYSMDIDFLRRMAYPFMVGAMRVYEEMLERDGNGGWALPVSVSPEYRGAALNAWGRNASFQLAAIHRLSENLIEAARILGESPDPLWADIHAGLPPASLYGPPGYEQIALWDGTPLEESHRHHSHLAGICPFDTLDLDDPAWQPIYERSLRTWIQKGMGMWSGWCVPWASMIHTRLHNPDMAELLLEIWDRVFTNEGHGTLHDCVFPGFTLIGAPPIVKSGMERRSVAQGALNKMTFEAPIPERMQMDAGMSATVAIVEMMLHVRRGVHHLFAGAPSHWKKVSFDGILTEGAFLVSAERVNNLVTQVRIHSQAGGTFRLENPWPGAATVIGETGAKKTIIGQILEIKMQAGECVVLTMS